MDIYAELQKVLLAEGSSDDVLKKEIIRQVIYKEASLLSVGEKIVPVKDFGELDIKFHFPSEFVAEYPVPEGAIAAYETPISWTDFDMTLDMAEVRWMLTDHAVLRSLEQYQANFSRRRASEALAKKKDDEILAALYAGAGATAVPATTLWSNTTAKPEDDLVKAIGNLLAESNISETEIMGLNVVVPVKVWAYPMRLQSIRNIIQSVADFMKTAYQMKFYPTRYSTVDALVSVYSDMTAVHGILQTNKIPLVEETRIKGRGTEYLIKQFFKTKVIPESSTVATSKRICKITDVTT